MDQPVLEHVHQWKVWESSDYDGCPPHIFGLICDCGATLDIDALIEIMNRQAANNTRAFVISWSGTVDSARVTE